MTIATTREDCAVRQMATIGGGGGGRTMMTTKTTTGASISLRRIGLLVMDLVHVVRVTMGMITKTTTMTTMMTS
jgi:hypothetical protein